jgi:hypothetical protein
MNRDTPVVDRTFEIDWVYASIIMRGDLFWPALGTFDPVLAPALSFH